MMQQAAQQEDRWIQDDAPPPLDNLPDQMHAAQLATSIIGTAGLQAGELRTAAVTDNLGRAEVSSSSSTTSACSTSAPKQLFKKGFLDAKPSASSSKARSSKVHSRDSQQQQHIPLIKPQQQQQQQLLGSKSIPDFLRVPPDAQEQRLSAVKSELLSALQPTPDTMSAVSQDPTLMAGFDDPDVMKAVAEVARDPSSFAKHANNPKVQQFYQAMGSLMGSKLEKMGTKQMKT